MSQPKQSHYCKTQREGNVKRSGVTDIHSERSWLIMEAILCYLRHSDVQRFFFCLPAVVFTAVCLVLASVFAWIFLQLLPVLFFWLLIMHLLLSVQFTAVRFVYCCPFGLICCIKKRLPFVYESLKNCLCHRSAIFRNAPLRYSPLCPICKVNHLVWFVNFFWFFFGFFLKYFCGLVYRFFVLGLFFFYSFFVFFCYCCFLCQFFDCFVYCCPFYAILYNIIVAHFFFPVKY